METQIVTSENGEEFVKTTLNIRSDLFWAMKQLAVEKRTKLTDLVNDAFHEFLASHGKRKGVKK